MDSVEESASNQYIVEAIRKKKVIRGEPWYYIKWQNYKEEENTWEPKRNCTGALGLIREFEANLEQQKRSKSVGARISRPLASRGERTPKKPDTCETSKRFKGLHLNIENQSTDSEPVIPKPSELNNAQNIEFRQDIPSHMNYEECRRSNPKATRGRTPKSKGPYSRKVLANANFNVSKRGARGARFDDSITDLNITSTCQFDCTTATTETEPMTTSNEEYTIEKLKKCSASEIEIVGAEPAGERVTIGIRALNDDNVFRLDSREVTELWAPLYVSFLESHIRFEDIL